MKTGILLGALAAIATTAAATHHFVGPPHITQIPRAEPTTTTIGRDPWQCITENITQFVDVPKPTGSLLSALQSYGDKLIETCTPTETVITAPPLCPFPAKSLWCGFTTAAPSAVLSAYTSYGSSASSWWAAKSSAAASVSKSCPVTWERVFAETPGGEAYWNNTLVFAECYADAHPTSASLSLSPNPTVTTRSGASGVSDSSPTSAATAGTNQSAAGVNSTNKPNGVLGRMQNVNMWMVASTGLTAAAVNSVW
ncbi:hypothetical protein BJ875DRAFT_474531 [Amylocarpus encephaloides]|uniref:DUF7735 domain-containing protein n=1 Tax=Amylocarpus encephaloides TaxID=45428 RepID=A0A9P7Y9K9_9HELO|nr:hypothetical protein BJ875DRAFT_474531 [Amylocarpus encephaloides]